MMMKMAKQKQRMLLMPRYRDERSVLSKAASGKRMMDGQTRQAPKLEWAVDVEWWTDARQNWRSVDR
jgi:hypothetical protein